MTAVCDLGWPTAVVICVAVVCGTALLLALALPPRQVKR